MPGRCRHRRPQLSRATWLESAGTNRLGKPTIIGPHHDDFADIVDVLQKTGGIVVTDRPCQVAEQLLTNSQKRQSLAQCGLDTISARQGATDKHAELLMGLLRTQPTTAHDPPEKTEHVTPATMGHKK